MKEVIVVPLRMNITYNVITRLAAPTARVGCVVGEWPFARLLSHTHIHARMPCPKCGNNRIQYTLFVPVHGLVVNTIIRLR